MRRDPWRVLEPVGVHAEREGQAPGGDVVELVALLGRLGAATRVELAPLELPVHELGIELGLRSEQRIDQARLRLRQIDHVAAGRKLAPLGTTVQIPVRGARAERLDRHQHLDLIAEQNLDQPCRALRIGAGHQHEALPAAPGGELVQAGAEELVIVAQELLAVLGCGAQRGQRRREVLGDPVPQAEDRAVVARPGVAAVAAAVGLVGHPDGAVQRRPAVPVARVVEVEDVAHVVVPAVAVERGAVGAAVQLGPADDLRLGQARVDR